MRERIAATLKALAKARAELAAIRKRQAKLVKLAEKKEASIASLAMRKKQGSAA